MKILKLLIDLVSRELVLVVVVCRGELEELGSEGRRFRLGAVEWSSLSGGDFFAVLNQRYADLILSRVFEL